MKELLKFLYENNFYLNAFSSALLITVVLISRKFIFKYLESKEWATDQWQLKVYSRVRQSAFFFILFGLIVIWTPQIHAFALSIAALAAAFVLATKELIMCLNGAFIKSTKDICSVGDRIEINGIKGDVIESTLFTITLMEIGQGNQRTGRLVTIPNSVFLLSPVYNESVVGKYTMLSLTFPIPIDGDWEKDKEILLSAVQRVCQDYLDDARKVFQRFTKKSGVSEPKADPRVIVRPYDSDTLHLIARFPALSSVRLRTEQAVLEHFLKERSATKIRKPKKVVD